MPNPAPVALLHRLSFVGGVGGWILSWLGAISVFPTEATTCTQGSDDAWAIGLFLGAPLLVIAAGLLYVSRASARRTRWFSLPHAILVPYAGFHIAKYLWGSTILGHHFCSAREYSASFDYYPQYEWTRIWAPIMLLALALLVLSIWRYWRAPAERAP